MTCGNRCGCKVDGAPGTPFSLRIVFCPLHLAAEELREALIKSRPLIEAMEDYEGEIVKTVRKALAHSEDDR